MENSNNNCPFTANKTRNGWYEIVDEEGDKVAEYRKGELCINTDYPLTTELRKELYFLILNLD